jgi:hypothetical protein
LSFTKELTASSCFRAAALRDRFSNAVAKHKTDSRSYQNQTCHNFHELPSIRRPYFNERGLERFPRGCCDQPYRDRCCGAALSAPILGPRATGASGSDDQPEQNVLSERIYFHFYVI